MRSVIACLAIVLGLVGVVIAIGLSIAVWPAAATVATRTNELTTTANQHIDEIEPVLASLQQLATTTAASVDQAGIAASRIADGTLKEDPALTRQVDEILHRLAPLLEQADSLGQVLQSVSAMMKSTARIQSAFGDSTDSTRLQTISDNLTRASTILNQVNADLKSLRGGKAIPQAEKIAELASLASPPLTQLAEGLSDARTQTVEVKGELTRVREKVQFWSIAGPPIVDAVLLWFGVGQLCLIGWGRRNLRPKSNAQPGS